MRTTMEKELGLLRLFSNSGSSLKRLRTLALIRFVKFAADLPRQMAVPLSGEFFNGVCKCSLVSLRHEDVGVMGEHCLYTKI